MIYSYYPERQGVKIVFFLPMYHAEVVSFCQMYHAEVVSFRLMYHAEVVSFRLIYHAEVVTFRPEVVTFRLRIPPWRFLYNKCYDLAPSSLGIQDSKAYESPSVHGHG